MKFSLLLVLLVAAAAAAAAKDISVTVDPNLPPLTFIVPDDDVTEASGRSLLHGKHDDPPRAPVNTFAWASINADLSLSNKQCAVACRAYNLAAITVPTANGTVIPLCRFTSNSVTYNGNSLISAGTALTFVPPQCTPNAGRPCPNKGQLVAIEVSDCTASSVDDLTNLSVDQTVGFTCACCGTINVKGRKMGKQCGQVTAWVPSNGTCPAAGNNKTWTSTGSAAGDICRRTTNLKLEDGSPSPITTLFGTLRTQADASLNCQIPYVQIADAGAWEKLCYQINSYSGPPAPSRGRKML